jgi:hypothetical protein
LKEEEFDSARVEKKEKEEKKRMSCTVEYDKRKDGKFRYRYNCAKFFILFV